MACPLTASLSGSGEISSLCRSKAGIERVLREGRGGRREGEVWSRGLPAVPGASEEP